MAAEQPVRRVVLASKVKRNPYVTLLCEGLGQSDLGISPRVVDQISWAWLRQQRPNMDLLHIHWLELFFIYPSLVHSLRRWLSVMLALVWGRCSGLCLVYTVHNVWQHEGKYPGLVWLANRLVLTLANAVHVHDVKTAEVLATHWHRRRNVSIIPHGNYVSAYPNSCERAQARGRLGLTGAGFVYLFIGRVRPYKGIEQLAEAFQHSAGSDAVLLVAGEVQDPGYEESIRAMVRGDRRVHLRLDFVDDDDLQYYFAACDVCVLPYRHVTTSGAALLAYSFGAPIIAPRLGCFVQLVGQDQRGLLYDPDRVDGLGEALLRAREVDLGAMRQQAHEFALELDWSRIARQHAVAYVACVR